MKEKERKAIETSHTRLRRGEVISRGEGSGKGEDATVMSEIS